MHYIKKN